MTEIRYTYTNINKNLEKLSNKKPRLLPSSYCALAWMFYSRVKNAFWDNQKIRNLRIDRARECIFKVSGSTNFGNLLTYFVGLMYVCINLPKNTLNMSLFLRLSGNPVSKYPVSKIISCMQWLFWVIYQN